VQVKDVMNKEVIRVTPATPLAGLIELFKDFHTFPMVPVVDEKNKLIGKVSFENLVDVFSPHTADTRRLLRGVPFLDIEEPLNIFKVEITPEMVFLFVVDDFMDRHVISVHEKQQVEDAYLLMKKDNKDNVPVVNGKGELAGMVGVFDIVLALFREKGLLQK